MDLKLDPASTREAVDGFCQRFQSFQVEYDDYIERLSQVTKYQAAGRKMVAHQRHELQELVETVFFSAPLPDDFRKEKLDILEDMSIRLAEMAHHFPRENNGIYLDIILGQINVSILNKLQRFRYKDDYEKFKLRVTIILFIFAPFVCYFHQRVLDAAYNFFLVWYYCTLTIRESILRCNGSRIKGWWLFHHYASAVLSGILLTWPDGECYQKSRLQLLLLSCYTSFVQVLQCNYQRGCLYRLRALGRRYSMDITVEGFHSWMFRGLTFLLPFLIFAYAYQLYTAYTLYLISKEVWCPEWQVTALALIFFGVAVGNTLTTAQVCLQKIQRKEENKRLQKKYHRIMQSETPHGSKDE